MTRQLPTPAEFFRMAVAFEGALVLAGAALGWLMSPPAWTAAEWNAEAALLGLLWSLPPLVSLVFLRQFGGGAVGHLNRTVDQFLVPLFSGLKLWHFALISILAGVGEELLFRGVLQQVLAGWTNLTTAIALTSIVFGLAHLITPLYGILAGAVSIYLGWLFVRYDNLAVPMVTHGLYDFVALLYLMRKVNNESRNANALDPPSRAELSPSDG